MDDCGFERFLIEQEKITSKNKAVSSRLSKARWIEKNLSLNLDSIIRDESKVLLLREKIYSKASSDHSAGNYYNALRWYFYFKNGYELPKQ